MTKLFFTVLMMVAVTGLCACSTAVQKPNEAPALHLPITQAKIESLSAQLVLPGVVLALPDRSVKVAPGIAGKLTDVKVVPGQQVTKGQVIALLDKRQLTEQVNGAHAKVLQAIAGVEQAKANLLLAEDTERRNAKLVAADVGAQKDLVAAQKQVDSAKAQLVAAKAQVDDAMANEGIAQAQLRYTVVKSPISGVVALRFLNVSDSVDSVTPIAEIVDLSQVIVDASLPSTEPANVVPGQTAIITTMSQPGGQLTGVVQSVAPVTDNQGTTIAIRILCNNPNLKFKEGMPVTTTIVTAIHRQAITVPVDALVCDPIVPDNKMVYIYNDGKIRRVEVTTGIQDRKRIEIISGLSAGQSIVASGAYGIPDGTEVQATRESLR